MSKIKVLIVEDNPQWRALLKANLVDVSEVDEAESHEETKKLLASKEFDLAIVDLRLTDYDHRDISGMSILAQLAELKIPAIVLTGYPTIETARTSFKEYEVIDYFNKADFELVDFRNTISKVLKQLEQNPHKKQKKRKIETK